MKNKPPPRRERERGDNGFSRNMVFTDSISSTLPHPMTTDEFHVSPTLFSFFSSQETMNELLESAEFLVHVAVPGAVAKPAIDAIGGDAPSWDVEGGGA